VSSAFFIVPRERWGGGGDSNRLSLRPPIDSEFRHENARIVLKLNSQGLKIRTTGKRRRYGRGVGDQCGACYQSSTELSLTYDPSGLVVVSDVE